MRFLLPGNYQGWFDINYTAWKGETLTLTAGGQIGFAWGGWNRGPDGRDENGLVQSPARQWDDGHGRHPAGDLVKNSLVVKIGDRVYQGGSNRQIYVEQAGRVMLSNNDNYAADNGGRWEGEIRMTKRSLTLRPLYLVPKDRAPNPSALDAINRGVAHASWWFSDVLLKAGHRMLFATEPAMLINSDKATSWFAATNPGTGDVPADWPFRNAVREAMRLAGASYNDPEHRWVVYFDAPGAGRTAGGIVAVPDADVAGIISEMHTSAGVPKAARWAGGLIHEIGHAFGWPDIPQSVAPNNIMSIGYLKYPSIDPITPAQVQVLRSSPFFQEFPK